MKSFLLVIQILIFTACSSVAQMQYSSTNKKAISLFEDAMAAANSMNEQTGYPNYPLGIELLNKALEKDPKFTEAYLVLAEFYQTMKKHKEAITAYEAQIEMQIQKWSTKHMQ